MRRLSLRYLVMLALTAAFLWMNADTIEAQGPKPGEIQPQPVEQIQPPVDIRSMEARVKQLEVEVEKLKDALESNKLAFSKHTHGMNLGEPDLTYIGVKGINPGTLLGEGYLVPLCNLQPCLGKDTLPPRL